MSETSVQKPDVVIEEHGIGVALTAVFIVGMMAGSGILALPMSIVQGGYAAIPMLIICGLISTYTGMVLGNCWSIVRARNPLYRTSVVSDPYPVIAYEAAGKLGRILCRISVISSLFGAGVVYLLLISGNMSNIIRNLSSSNLPACYWIIIVAAVLTPFTWLGTPKDFWLTAFLAAATTTIAAVFIVVDLGMIGVQTKEHKSPNFIEFFTSFGTILYAYGGSTCFPTLQVDMKEPKKFSWSVYFGLGATLFLYLPVSLAGFFILGDDMQKSNILDELSQEKYLSWIVYPALILMTLHLLMAFIIIINPVSQDLEGLLGTPKKFCWQRVVVRSVNMALMLFTGLTIPHFGIILSLVGGVATTATSFIFPPLFYMLLVRQRPRSDDDCDVMLEEETDKQDAYPPLESLPSRVAMVTIIIIGLVGAVSSLYSVIQSLVDGSSGFTVPCYVNMTCL